MFSAFFHLYASVADRDAAVSKTGNSQYGKMWIFNDKEQISKKILPIELNKHIKLG